MYVFARKLSNLTQIGVLENTQY